MTLEDMLRLVREVREEVCEEVGRMVRQHQAELAHRDRRIADLERQLAEARARVEP